MDNFCPRYSLRASSPPRPNFPKSFSARDLEEESQAGLVPQVEGTVVMASIGP